MIKIYTQSDGNKIAYDTDTKRFVEINEVNSWIGDKPTAFNTYNTIAEFLKSEDSKAMIPIFISSKIKNMWKYDISWCTHSEYFCTGSKVRLNKFYHECPMHKAELMRPYLAIVERNEHSVTGFIVLKLKLIHKKVAD